MSKKIDNFLREIVRLEILLWWFNVQSILFHLVDGRRASRFPRLRFCFCLWPGCNHTWACWYTFLFLWICKIFRVVFDVIVHIPNCSVGNSDPRMRIVFVHGLNSNFDSVLEVLKNLSSLPIWVPILVFPRIHPFGWEAWSSRRRVYSRQAIVCWNSLAFLVTKIFVQLLQHS